MQLAYLLFDASDEEIGACSFDAMASVLPDRLPALLREVEAVLGWAYRRFGPPADAEEGEWDFALQAVGEPDVALAITYDFESERVSMAPGVRDRVRITLTLGGSYAFGEAFREAFPESD